MLAANDSNTFQISLDVFDHMKHVFEKNTSSDREMYEGDASPNVNDMGGKSKASSAGSASAVPNDTVPSTTRRLPKYNGPLSPTRVRDKNVVIEHASTAPAGHDDSSITWVSKTLLSFSSAGSAIALQVVLKMFKTH